MISFAVVFLGMILMNIRFLVLFWLLKAKYNKLIYWMGVLFALLPYIFFLYCCIADRISVEDSNANKKLSMMKPAEVLSYSFYMQNKQGYINIFVKVVNGLQNGLYTVRLYAI